MLRFKFSFLAAFAACTLLGANVDAALVSYSFTSNSAVTGQTGAGVIGTATDQWMTEFVPIDATGTTVDDVPLNDVDGNPTGATLSHLGLRRHNTAGQAIGAGNPTPLQASVYMRHLNDDPFYLIEGLLPGSAADIVLFGTYHLAGIDRGSEFTIAGDTLGGGSATTTGAGSRTTFDDGRNYVRFDSLVVGPSGSIRVDINGNSTNFSDVNGFQIEFTPVPEPSTVVLGGLALAGLFVCRKVNRQTA